MSIPISLTFPIGFYPLAMALLSLVFLLGSLRTNAIFSLIFVAATCGFGFASAGLFYTAAGMADTGNTMVVATGACFFAADLLGWYLLVAIMCVLYRTKKKE